MQNTNSPDTEANRTSALNKPVFFSSVALIFLITIAGAIIPETLETVFGALQSWLNSSVSWLYILSVALSLLFCVYLMLSKYGAIKLGPDHSSPDFTFGSWIAMLFSAGMGIGLLFFGVAEPVMHFLAPPVGDAQTAQAAMEAMKITFFHWGLHAWGAYALLALCLAYFSYRHNLPLLPRSIVYPILGEKIRGPIGHAIDTFAVVGTMFGVATSLGFGITQINAGLNYLLGVPVGIGTQFILISLVTLAATASVVLGLDGGIKKLSNLNMIFAVVLLLFVLIAGPTAFLLNTYVQNVGVYFSSIIQKTFNLYSYQGKEDWIGGWTLMYWGWWVSWAPFVGMFIARISRGRTIKEFLACVMFVPAGFTFLWLTVFGNTAIDAIMNGGAEQLAATVNENVPVALFQFFELLPFSNILSTLGVLLVTTFFITSSDSGSLVIDTLTSGGAAEPPVWQKIFWAVSEGLVAAVLLYAGGLKSLQTLAITSAFPLMILLMVAGYCLLIELRRDHALKTSVGEHSASLSFEKTAVDWKSHLRSLVSRPSKDEVKNYIVHTVNPALKEVASEMRAVGLDAKIKTKGSLSELIVQKEDSTDFIYSVKPRTYKPADLGLEDEKESIHRVEVFLGQGGQDYNIYQHTKEQIIADVLSQYDKHLQYLHLTHGELV